MALAAIPTARLHALLSSHRSSHQVALVEEEDEMLVPQVLADVLLEEEAPGAHGVPRVKDLEWKMKKRGGWTACKYSNRNNACKWRLRETYEV